MRGEGGGELIEFQSEVFIHFQEPSKMLSITSPQDWNILVKTYHRHKLSSFVFPCNEIISVLLFYSVVHRKKPNVTKVLFQNSRN